MTRYMTSAGLAGLVWLIFTAGCGPVSERYYCDDMGCYFCDGNGCVDVASPIPASCTGNRSCTSGTVCTSAGCLSTCTASASCPQGTVCKAERCLAPKAPVPVSKDCSSFRDCSKNTTCRAETCVPCGGTSGPCPCDTGADCGVDTVCAAGLCTSSRDACKYASECAVGSTCADGQCVVSCTSACPSGFSCVDGVCTTVPVATCPADEPCPSIAPNCVLRQCVGSCTQDADCAAGQFCNQGVCLSDTRPKPNCVTDQSCQGSSGPTRACVAGYCKYRCVSNGTCASIDARIAYCAMDGVCRSASEANPQCTWSGDCSGGLRCIDNACR